MNLKEILAISGYSGLYRFISQGRSGVIVEGLIDKKRMNATSSMRVSALDDIAIFTSDKEVPLKEVFRLIFKKEDGKASIDPKSPVEKLKGYFLEILPEYDQDKVYVSDMKKVFTWYNLLLAENMIDLEEDKEIAKEAETENKETEKEVKEAKAATKEPKEPKAIKEPKEPKATKATVKEPNAVKAKPAKKNTK
jgi:hypothetical protein